jgi:SOS-response transcriptional repressor LexA
MVIPFLQALQRRSRAIPPGYVLMPANPTIPMIMAGHEAAREGVTGVYAAMVRAAPTPNGEQS